MRGSTLILNGPIERVSRPSLTVIVMSVAVADIGVRGRAGQRAGLGAELRPGRLIRDREFEEVVVGVARLGVNEYGCPASTAAGGVPLISGGDSYWRRRAVDRSGCSAGSWWSSAASSSKHRPRQRRHQQQRRALRERLPETEL